MYDEHMKQHYAYLVIDCTPQYPSKIKVRADIFPGQLILLIFKRKLMCIFYIMYRIIKDEK